MPGEDVGRFLVNDTAYTRWGDVSRVRHVGEVGNNIEHPVSKAEGLHRWRSDLKSIFFHLIKNRLDSAILLGDLLIDAMFWKGDTLREAISLKWPLHALQATLVAGPNVDTVLHHDHQVFRSYLAEVVSNNDGSLVLVPLLDHLEHS